MVVFKRVTFFGALGRLFLDVLVVSQYQSGERARDLGGPRGDVIAGFDPMGHELVHLQGGGGFKRLRRPLDDSRYPALASSHVLLNSIPSHHTAIRDAGSFRRGL